jgi:hypothetical protein
MKKLKEISETISQMTTEVWEYLEKEKQMRDKCLDSTYELDKFTENNCTEELVKKYGFLLSLRNFIDSIHKLFARANETDLPEREQELGREIIIEGSSKSKIGG